MVKKRKSRGIHESNAANIGDSLPEAKGDFCPRCGILRTPETLKINLEARVKAKAYDPEGNMKPVPPVIYALIRCTHCFFPERTALAPYFKIAIREAFLSAAIEKDMAIQRGKDEQTKKERLVVEAKS